jgi:hypothetical protein
VGHLGSGNTEQSYEIVSIIAKAKEAEISHFAGSYQSFFCHHHDPAYLKLKKIEVSGAS